MTATTTRQTTIFGVQDWQQIYQTYREADFQSYDFETLRKCFVDYLTLYYPETFNDYVESSEFIALLDVMAFMGQSLAFRTDLNTRENYIDTAERRDSVVKLATLVSYTPLRNTEANGYLKVFSVRTTENVVDYNGVNLSNITVNWADPSNYDWQEQFTTIINAALASTQRIGVPANSAVINGVNVDEYTINIIPGYLPIVPYTSTIDGINMPFEAVSSTSVQQSIIYEPNPLPNGQFNFLFQNDLLGYASANTGFFFYFKQGTLQSQDFNLAERISNRTVNINIEGVNNTDVWLYQLDSLGNVALEWTKVDNVYAAATEQGYNTVNTFFSVTSRTNDQITLNFGDGIFSAIPVGQFRCYVRASNGLEYIINPVDMQSISIPINYVSRTGQVETLTFTCGITQPVSNAQARETIAQIKENAPARYYTQNRMVNGEDYTNFPFSTYNSILKSSALNRASIGTSRYLDFADNTGKYSSTNIFSSDGALWEDVTNPTFLFSFVTNNDIYNVISNKMNPILTSSGLEQFYYANYPRPDLSTLNISWNQSTYVVNECTGYFVDSSDNPVMLGTYSSTNTKYIQEGCVIQFNAPTGYYFDENNLLQPGIPVGSNQKYTIWASPSAVILDGTTSGFGNLTSGEGPVVLDIFVPTGAICVKVIPVLATDIPNSLATSIQQQILSNRNFGIGYNNLTSTLYLITSPNLAVNAPFSLANQQNTTGTNSDASWLIQATVSNGQYTVINRALDYSFGSVIQTRFFFYTNQKIYDSRTGTTVRDFINVLKSNSQPNSNNPLYTDVIMPIIDQPVEPDGYVDDYKVLVTFEDSDDNGIPLDPDFFNDITGAGIWQLNGSTLLWWPQNGTAMNTRLVFFQNTIDFDNLERYLLLDSGVVNSLYPTKTAIELVMYQYLAGQVFYAYADNSVPSTGIKPNFYTLVMDANGVKSLVLNSETDYLAKTGRQNLYFQYRHNSPLTSIIDPGTTNIIDLYVVPNNYYVAYQNWITDITGTVTKPDVPTLDQLTSDYAGLQNYKMISDNLIVNCVEFVPLFGAKADVALQATIKVIPAANTNATTNEIKNLVVANMNAYFTLDNWNFGQTFYFSELSAYLHQNIGDVISSAVLVPNNTLLPFGSLYQINAAPNQIFVNGATIDNIEVIQAITPSNLQIGV
jgi:hypothetical protein